MTFRSDDTAVPNTLPAFTLHGNIEDGRPGSDYDIEFLLLIPKPPAPGACPLTAFINKDNKGHSRPFIYGLPPSVCAFRRDLRRLRLASNLV